MMTFTKMEVFFLTLHTCQTLGQILLTCNPCQTDYCKLPLTKQVVFNLQNTHWIAGGPFFLSGVYAMGTKRSHTGVKCVTCSGLTNSREGQLRLPKSGLFGGNHLRTVLITEDS